MPRHDITPWLHSHAYTHGHERESERRVTWVTWMAATMMVVEILGGWWLGSMALLADGWHMSTHAMALGAGAYAYRYARIHAGNPAYSFGTGKVHALGGFASALLLAVVALYVAGESLWRLVHPQPVAYAEAIAVAALGLAANAASALLLHGGQHHHDHDHDHPHEHHHDTNLLAAYAHLLADALLSVLVIIGLLIGHYLGFTRADPLVGIIGATIIAQWSLSLLRRTTPVLLDREPDAALAAAIRAKLEADGDSQVADFHLWHVAPGQLAAIIALVTHAPHDSAYYKAQLASFGLVHVTIEVNRCTEHAA